MWTVGRGVVRATGSSGDELHITEVSTLIDDEEIRADERAQLAVEGVVGTRTGQSLQQKVGFPEQDAVIGAAGGVTESLSQEAFTDADGAAEDHVLAAFNEVEAEQVGQPCLIDLDFCRPLETLQRALFLEAGSHQPVG